MFDSLVHQNLRGSTVRLAADTPRWKKIGFMIINEPIYFGLLSAINILSFMGSLFIDYSEQRNIEGKAYFENGNRYEQIILIVNTVVYFIDMTLSFIVIDFGDILLHYKMTIVEIFLQIISIIMIFDSTGWKNMAWAENDT